MKTFTLVCSLFLMIGLAACGSTSSSDDSGDEEVTFTSTDAHNVGASLYNSMSAASTAILNQYATDSTKSVDLAKTTKTGTIPINEVYSCFVSGHITSTGNFNWSLSYPDYPETTPEASASIRGQLMQQVSDPTNNLYDCEVGDGIILDGTIYSQYTYDWTESGGARAVFSTDGSIGINNRGPTGGLVPITDDCSIFFSITINVTPAGVASGNASGTICGESYSFSF